MHIPTANTTHLSQDDCNSISVDHESRDDEHSFRHLQKAAEEILSRKERVPATNSETLSDQELMDNLHIHQIELELQNEELINARHTADELRLEYQTLFDVAPVGYLVLGQKSVVLRCNSRAAELFGTTTNHLTGKRLAAFLDQTTLADFHAFFQNCCKEEPAHPCECYSRSAHTLLSGPQHLHFFGKGIQSENESHLCIVAVSDITELHRYQDALREVNRKLHLLSNITRHDILNQVMVLAASLELIRVKTAQGGQIDTDLTRCDTAREAIERIITFTRGYVNIGTEKTAWQPVGTIAETACKKTALMVTVDPSMDGIDVYADMMMGSVFFNLFQNAEKHGGRVRRITTSFHQNGQEGILVIEDDGTGIPDDMKEKIFMRGVGEGTGLGLFFCSEILGITGIRICETGTPGEGARFELHIPGGVWRTSVGESSGVQ